MNKSPTPSWSFPALLLGLLSVIGVAYAPLIFHPTLHPACPENDTWNLPIRWSVLSSLRGGRLPLWNPLSAFGIPWLATWQTESFYPGTLLFAWLGLSAWNLSGLLHLLVFSTGIFYFLKSRKVGSFWSFLGAAIALLNGCAYNHLGSNSSMDTMAWIPWMFWATRQVLDGKPWGRIQLGLFLALQIFAGYPQIIFYTVIGCFFYAWTLKGKIAPTRLFAPLAAGLMLSAAQWIPSMEYFFLNCVRHPAVPNNPHFFLPLENLKTLFDFNALAKDAIPDYVASPTFFYFNFYSGFLPLFILLLGLVRFNRLKTETRFFLVGLFLWALWAVGLFLKGLSLCHIPFPAFLEPAKCWVLINMFELAAVGMVLGDLFPKPGVWKWGMLLLALANLLVPILEHPLEKNLTPPDPILDSKSEIIRENLGSGRVLILPNAPEHTRLYTPMPDPALKPLFKHFVPNSNFFVSIPTATFYGSTQPSWGALDAGFYFQYGFPYEGGSLMDLLGVDLLYLPESSIPARYRKIASEDGWTLWKNPTSLGSHFFFYGSAKKESRREIFTGFAQGKFKPPRDLFLEPIPISNPSLFNPPMGAQEISIPQNQKMDYLVVTQNAIPGWRAWVDGLPAPLYLADGIFLGVHFNAGNRQVQLSYEPASFRFGLFVSLLTFGFGIVLVGFRGRGKSYFRLS